MRIVVVETAESESKREVAMRLAVDLAWSKGYPVYLDFGDIVSSNFGGVVRLVKVMPWDSIDDVKNTINKGVNA